MIWEGRNGFKAHECSRTIGILKRDYSATMLESGGSQRGSLAAWENPSYKEL